MKNNLKDILAHSNKDLDNQQLMDYLTKQIAEADNHAVEMKMAEDEFTNDAIEGLQEIKKKKDLPLYVEQLNKDFEKTLQKTKQRKDRRSIKNQRYTYFAVLLIILLIIICINILRRSSQHKQVITKPIVILKSPPVVFKKNGSIT